MIITTRKPERPEALDAIRHAVLTGVYDWPAIDGKEALTKQLAAHLHTTIHNSEFETILDAYDDYVGRLDWNQEEILDYLGETRWHPALEDAAYEKALRTLTETTNTILLAMSYDILSDQECADLYTDITETTTLRSAA